MRDLTTPEQIRIRDELVKFSQTPKQATAGILANFRCEYCQLVFLDPQHPDNVFQWVGWDHLVPRCAGGSDEIDNLVCCCRVCNWVKRRFDPRKKFATRPNPPSRDELIDEAREHIKEKKLRYERDVTSRWRQIVGRQKAGGDQLNSARSG